MSINKIKYRKQEIKEGKKTTLKQNARFKYFWW